MASRSEFPLGTSRVVPGRYPPPGIDPHADAIRERRGARGITPLDANLLHVPPIAGGFNSLLGAVRTKGNLPADVREAIILRVAAINHATFEWIHHEIVGRNEGLTTGQLYIIRDTETPLPPIQNVLNPLLTAAIGFTDHSTRNVRVPADVIQELKKQIKDWIIIKYPSLTADEVTAKTDDLYVESSMVVASYNMVSRFLLATDVAGISDVEVPWPVDKKEHFVSVPSFPPASTPSHTIHAVTLTTSPSAPWLVFANSLLTDWAMWSYIVPYFLDLASCSNASDNDHTEQKETYNILLHSQRGHGKSTLPPPSDGHDRLATIPLLATDIANLLSALSIPTPVQSVIGVSQGGAAALAFAALYGGTDESPAKTKSVIACDTGPRTPAGNKEAWEDRISLVYGSLVPPNSPDISLHFAKKIGMSNLAEITVPRWFPPGSILNSGERGGDKRAKWVEKMIKDTDVDGFVHGARALSDYNLINPSDLEANENATPGLFNSHVGRVLLLAGSLDGGGKVAKGLQDLRTKWNEKRLNDSQISLMHEVEYLEIEKSGHLPMIDSPEIFCENVGQWLGKV
ncbi:Alpha/Beta hydrolase protein [Gymnopilus junonius]|uniref:Alpha/Beta hydrolase protein n=1 Tax=Gymnopilus junonius TaxID=109634 RepID=A0A9P5ND88_GYMJU|nr:Alpha/Beta hydrolase protein [Gymnopilus junonius]